MIAAFGTEVEAAFLALVHHVDLVVAHVAEPVHEIVAWVLESAPFVTGAFLPFLRFQFALVG